MTLPESEKIRNVDEAVAPQKPGNISNASDEYVLGHQLCLIFCDPHGPQPARLLCPWNFPGKNTGVGCHFLFQGIFLT